MRSGNEQRQLTYRALTPGVVIDGWLMIKHLVDMTGVLNDDRERRVYWLLPQAVRVRTLADVRDTIYFVTPDSRLARAPTDGQPRGKRAERRTNE